MDNIARHPYVLSLSINEDAEYRCHSRRQKSMGLAYRDVCTDLMKVNRGPVTLRFYSTCYKGNIIVSAKLRTSHTFCNSFLVIRS